jgi:hypothetical protein
VFLPTEAAAIPTLGERTLPVEGLDVGVVTLAETQPPNHRRQHVAMRHLRSLSLAKADRSGDCPRSAPAKAKPECETRTSSVCVMANSMGSVPSPCG